jgi:hypothetical protein
MRILLLLSFSTLFAQDAWFIISGNQNNPFWKNYAHGIESACKNHHTTCHIDYTPNGSFIDQAKALQTAMRSKPKGISINIPEAQQLTTLLKQANSNDYPLVISASGLRYYRDLKLKSYVGPNLNELRALIVDQLQPSDFDNIIVSTFASADHDHKNFIQSLVPESSNSKVVKPDDLSDALLHNNDTPVTLITFGTRSANTAFGLLKSHLNWKVKWIQIDGPSDHNPLTAEQISTHPFMQGYETVMLIIFPKEERQEILIRPKSST